MEEWEISPKKELDGAEERETLRAHRMVMSGRGMAPSERGIVEREAMSISEDAKNGTKEPDTKPRRATQSNNQQLDLFELNLGV